MRIAVVGSGISGLTAALLLKREHDVTLFEASSKLGGHTNTIAVEEATQTLAIDTGFIVFNDRTYPLFERLLQTLNVPWQNSDMSFSMRCERTGLEYSGSSLNTMFAQRSNLLSPKFYGMIRDILRFNRSATQLLLSNADPTLGEYLRQERYGLMFIEQYLYPMGAAIWSADPHEFGAMPARFFIRFFEHHGLLSINNRPQWRTVQGGSQQYVAAIARHLGDRVRTNCGVTRIVRDANQVTLTTVQGEQLAFDQVVLATHSDQALELLAEPTSLEREVLTALPYQENTAVLHTDESLLPRRRLAWASWNYHNLNQPHHQVAVTYWMNNLQSLKTQTNYCVTLNHTSAIKPEKIIREIQYHHPVFTQAGVAAQARHQELNGQNRTWYCGAYWRNGFHEDGVWSAWQMLQHMGVNPDHELAQVSTLQPIYPTKQNENEPLFPIMIVTDDHSIIVVSSRDEWLSDPDLWWCDKDFFIDSTGQRFNLLQSLDSKTRLSPPSWQFNCKATSAEIIEYALNQFKVEQLDPTDFKKMIVDISDQDLPAFIINYLKKIFE